MKGIEFEENKNQTRQDAYERMLNARIGMLANNPSVEYLQGMIDQLYSMVASVKDELHAVLIKETKE